MAAPSLFHCLRTNGAEKPGPKIANLVEAPAPPAGFKLGGEGGNGWAGGSKGAQDQCSHHDPAFVLSIPPGGVWGVYRYTRAYMVCRELNHH